MNIQIFISILYTLFNEYSNLYFYFVYFVQYSNLYFYFVYFAQYSNLYFYFVYFVQYSNQSRISRFTLGFWWGPCCSFFSFLCCVFSLFVFVMCLVYPLLPMSLGCPFFISPSVFSSVYLYHILKISGH